MYLFDTFVPTVYKVEVKDFFFTIEFNKDGSSLTRIVNGREILLDEVFHREIQGVPIVGIGSVQDQQPLLLFVQSLSKVSGGSELELGRNF